MTGTVQAVHAKLRGRSVGEMRSVLRRRLKSDIRSYGLRRDLRIPFETPVATIPVTVRPLQESDLPILLREPDGEESEAEHTEKMRRVRMYHAGFTTCWVAVTDSGEPCYCQWLFGPEQQERLEAQFSGIFPRLGPDEALLEGAYTPPAFRGKRIMPSAMAQIAEKGEQIGARWVLTFVDEENIPSLKGCARAGFRPYVLRDGSWRAFRHRVRFTELPEGTAYPFE